MTGPFAGDCRRRSVLAQVGTEVFSPVRRGGERSTLLPVWHTPDDEGIGMASEAQRRPGLFGDRV